MCVENKYASKISVRRNQCATKISFTPLRFASLWFAPLRVASLRFGSLHFALVAEDNRVDFFASAVSLSSFRLLLRIVSRRRSLVVSRNSFVRVLPHSVFNSIRLAAMVVPERNRSNCKN